MPFFFCWLSRILQWTLRESIWSVRRNKTNKPATQQDDVASCWFFRRAEALEDLFISEKSFQEKEYPIMTRILHTHSFVVAGHCYIHRSSRCRWTQITRSQETQSALSALVTALHKREIVSVTIQSELSFTSTHWPNKHRIAASHQHDVESFCGWCLIWLVTSKQCLFRRLLHGQGLSSCCPLLSPGRA